MEIINLVCFWAIVIVAIPLLGSLAIYLFLDVIIAIITSFKEIKKELKK